MGADAVHSFVEQLSWDAVAQRIERGAAAILPIGAAAKEHGFHLPLNTDRIQARSLPSVSTP
jgi:creatinine amidohydrolase